MAGCSLPAQTTLGFAAYSIQNCQTMRTILSVLVVLTIIGCITCLGKIKNLTSLCLNILNYSSVRKRNTWRKSYASCQVVTLPHCDSEPILDHSSWGWHIDCFWPISDILVSADMRCLMYQFYLSQWISDIYEPTMQFAQVGPIMRSNVTFLVIFSEIAQQSIQDTWHFRDSKT